MDLFHLYDMKFLLKETYSWTMVNLCDMKFLLKETYYNGY